MDENELQIKAVQEEGQQTSAEENSAPVEPAPAQPAPAPAPATDPVEKKMPKGESSMILDQVKGMQEGEGDGVIYGIYDNSDKGVMQRFRDWQIDHMKITLKDKSFFFHMLAVMVDAGIPLVEATKSIAERVENLRFRRVLRTVAYNAERGLNFSDAMTRFKDVFDESEIGIVRSGEATGKLHKMLFKLSERLDKRNDLNSKLWGAAVYPIAVLGVLVLVAVGMLLWVFPTLLDLLQEGGVEKSALPGPTKVLLFVQNAIVNYWWGILLGVFGLYGLFLVYISTEFGILRWHLFLLRVPLVGRLLRKVSVLRFIDMMGLLIDAGVPVLKTLEITGNSLNNRVYRLKTNEVIEGVRVGGRISDNLADSEFLFPPEVVQMLNVGEASASLAPISEKISIQYDKEIDSSLKKLTAVFEPLMILVVGVFVALLALAIMAPIFNLGSVVGT